MTTFHALGRNAYEVNSKLNKVLEKIDNGCIMLCHSPQGDRDR